MGIYDKVAANRFCLGIASLQRCALKPEPVKILKGLLSNPFKIFTVVQLVSEIKL
jgi:hypothetical protein